MNSTVRSIHPTCPVCKKRAIRSYKEPGKKDTWIYLHPKPPPPAVHPWNEANKAVGYLRREFTL